MGGGEGCSWKASGGELGDRRLALQPYFLSPGRGNVLKDPCQLFIQPGLCETPKARTAQQLGC